jgi:DNA-binding transcriptional LysR family regulator
LLASDESDNLLFAEADIAVRMYRPKQLELITRHIGDIELGAFAARSYIQRKGRPTNFNDLAELDIVGFDQSTLITDHMKAMGMPADPEMFAVRCDNQTAYWQLVRAGCGVGFTQAHTGRGDPLVEELDLGLNIPALPVWLAAHPSARKTPRVDRIWALLSELLPDVINPSAY